MSRVKRLDGKEILKMIELHKEWLEELYQNEIIEVRGTIRNEHLMELGYDGEEENPHTKNIENLEDYIELLQDLISELEEK